MKKLFRITVFPLLLLGLVACGGSANNSSGSVGPTASDTGSTASAPANEQPQSINREPRPGGNFLDPFPLNQIISGGVPKDGIPALTDPPFLSSAQASYITDDDLVLGVVINGEAKAYPHRIGWQNEIINDIVGGIPIVASFCPLTSTGMIFSGEGNDGARLTCGVSGLLFNNNLIMYDRRDGQTLYPQMIFSGIDGPNSGSDLTLLPVVETTWRYWKQLYPNTLVVSPNNQIFDASAYRSYPYGSYRNLTTPPMFPISPTLTSNPTSALFQPKATTLGIRFGETAKAYPFPAMGSEAVINDSVDNNPIVVAFYAREQFAVPFSRQLDRQVLTFDKVASTDPVFPFMLQDKETGTTWNLKGEAVAGTLSGQKLEQIPAHNAFWFAWSTFWQNTGIY
ncbi:MAG: DUF3179 domain-containing protein [bacterium]|nr:DUF3179 domain-containing protein [bacterium]